MGAPKNNQFAKGCTTSGRPSIYTKEWCDEEANALREFIKKDDGYYIGTFAKRRGYHRRRIPEFVKKSDEFARAYEEAQMWQEEKFIVKALTKEWDAGFTFKCMARVCGDEWKNSWDREEEKTEQIPVVYSIDFSNCQITPNGIQFNPAESKDVCQNSKTSQDKSSTDGQ